MRRTQMTCTILVFFALMITAQPSLADCPAFLMTPRIQTVARKIIASFKEDLANYPKTTTQPRTSQEFKEQMYRLVWDRLRQEISITRKDILGWRKDGVILDMARTNPGWRERLESNPEEYPNDANEEGVNRVFRDAATAYVCFPDFGPFLQLAKESYESKVRKEEGDAAEARGPIGQLRQTYLVFITLQRCGAEQDYSGPLVTKPDLERAKEATRRAESRLAPQLDQGLPSTQVWDQALALPPLQGGMSRFRCVQLLSALLGANPAPLRIEKP